ncbi:MAG: peptidase MA family metallohydrolase [candidate division KSB1 bacterium]|nr:peptidase MA family metallohydrolase [candidate division KSB1 bacterium]MDZ7273131.1 peptidase MA family metallohydrolase [candidate division KSB1 bacterium]MDZ7285233.1 peptidase MA family metallohydrolase [candidate division KSB1 bacterium]MDZ7298265.1 peptidase MA family metallohydrolase [candidate division KSB1 bacterium]MDZ7308986.1 peptidase MA family metallohydrolase [candidate division KSB1 bacterium]
MKLINNKIFASAVRRLRLAGGCAAAVVLLLAPPLRPQDWQYLHAGRFTLAHVASEEKLAAGLLVELERQQQQLSERLQFRPRRPLTVFLCPSQYSFDYLTRHLVPDWGEAAVDVNGGRMFLKSPAANRGRELQPATLRHELVHVMLAEMVVPHRAPRWFDEGVATWLSGETQHVSPTLISSAMATHSLLSFDAIEELLTFPNPRAGLAYSISFHAVNYLVQQYGEAALVQYARSLAAQGDPRAAFQAAFQKDLWDFEAEYFDYLRANFRWYFLLDENVLWSLALLLLVVAGFIATRRRIRRRMREMQEEDRDPTWHEADPAGQA